ncbi:MAG TPA: hypothetical protein VF126_13705 [Acidobacteriaceae bacterium]
MAFRSLSCLLSASLLTAVFLYPAAAPAAETHFPNNPTRFLVCDKGSGSFHGKLPDKFPHPWVTVSVGAGKKNEFAARTCDADINWSEGNVSVASGAAQADIDVMGADIGLGSLVVAFQIKSSDTDPHIRYEIYSLTGPPQLLRTITNEDYFSAADTRLNGSVEIWTTDAAAVDGFENLPRAAFDVPPTMVLRFEDKKLIDVSSEFRPWFDQQIAALRSGLDAHQLDAFKNSDGALSAMTPPPNSRPTGLLAAKVKVLEIVWAYLASGREQEAWSALAQMWPASDVERIRTAILKARAAGLRTQVDGVSDKRPPTQKEHAFVYWHLIPLDSHDLPAELRARTADTVPSRLVWMVAPPQNPENWSQGRHVELVIDEAGKVRSVKIKEKEKDASDHDWVDAAAAWKYIPAYKDGKPVAFGMTSHLRRNQ